MTDSYDALRNANSPEAFCTALEAIAADLDKVASVMDSSWQDSRGRPWRKLARSLDKVAATFGVRGVGAAKPCPEIRRTRREQNERDLVISQADAQPWPETLGPGVNDEPA